MITSPKKAQLILIAAIVILIGVLLSLNLKAPNTTKSKGKSEGENTEAAATTLSLAEEARNAKNTLTDANRRRIEGLERELKNAGDEKRPELIREIAEAYAASSRFGVAAMYTEELLAKEENTANLLLAADAYRNAYRNEDSTKTAFFSGKALAYYQKVLEKDPENLDAKTGLGSYYVDLSENPMQGIALLREVVEKDPENLNANLNLGMFSMRSGQYDKAIARFETVAKLKPSAEVYVYLAEAQEKSGDKSGAAKSLGKAKEYIIDPNVLRGIDDYIKTLK
jgi:tetratricopeptide (TPR) repeat protein